MSSRLVAMCLVSAFAFGQGPSPSPPPGPSAPPVAPAPPRPPAPSDATAGSELRRRDIPVNAGVVLVTPGTHILLNMINSVSTKQALVGDRIYLETAFPVIANGRIVVPQGSWVTGTVTQVRKARIGQRRGSMQVRFDSLTLPNGVSRNFAADLGSLDSRDNQSLKRESSTVEGPGNKAGSAATVASTTVTGAAIGTGIGVATRSIGTGVGIGAGAGAAAGLLVVLLTKGPNATLLKGSTVEMVLDRPLSFLESDLDFRNALPHAALSQGYPQPAATRRTLGSRIPY